MGDVGALALGAALGTIAVIVRQEIVLFIMGGVFVVETLSVILQVASFKLTGKRDLPDGADAPSLRIQGLEGEPGRRALLDHHDDARPPRRGGGSGGSPSRPPCWRLSGSSRPRCSRAPRRTCCSTFRGMPSRSRASGVGVWVRWAATTACAVGPRERRLARQHLVPQHAQRVDVGSMVDVRVGRRLLRRHVRRRADRQTGARDRRLAAPGRAPWRRRSR